MPFDTSQPEVTFFESASEFREWLAAHHDSASELWMGLRKKHVQPRGLTWEEAVPEALCFGWIDSVVYSLGPDAVRQRWSPRRRGSTWSKVNIALVEALTEQGRMHPAGLAAFAARSADKQGIYAYEQAEAGQLPAEYAALLAADPRASAFWGLAAPSYRKSCIWWVVSAKQESTRARRMQTLIDSCAAYEPIPQQRYGDLPGWVTRARTQLEGL